MESGKNDQEIVDENFVFAIIACVNNFFQISSKEQSTFFEATDFELVPGDWYVLNLGLTWVQVGVHSEQFTQVLIFKLALILRFVYPPVKNLYRLAF